MIQFVYIFFLSFFLALAPQKKNTLSVEEYFSKAEVRDLKKLVNFFQSQFCGDFGGFEDCMNMRNLELFNNGYLPIIENIDFEKQEKLYSKLKSGLFHEIWKFCESRSSTEKGGVVICLNSDGKYLKFIKDLSVQNTDLKEYYMDLISSGGFESMGILQNRILSNPEFYDLSDFNIQVLITVHFLSINDFKKRWGEREDTQMGRFPPPLTN
ncbi:hypothetical protein [Algoriphagus zhangzhouensis]|uniref:Uncharacterized protein n=1 Tax=Algoriphagus zhangzhouensis TaxID=1073327 RepID=A0A1M7ZH87_9BACT|nr:hypothetical protein [Algoriphagus zhangzhouensis]TDY44135.1 hypothetical protein A8938_3345 [Algoriphagus zhangzhouensis]SHO64275.1 hypothetical protein SAMN04488108_3340 [Algoriphagus zhangzhouensis]